MTFIDVFNMFSPSYAVLLMDRKSRLGYRGEAVEREISEVCHTNPFGLKLQLNSILHLSFILPPSLPPCLILCLSVWFSVWGGSDMHVCACVCACIYMCVFVCVCVSKGLVSLMVSGGSLYCGCLAWTEESLPETVCMVCCVCEEQSGKRWFHWEVKYWEISLDWMEKNQWVGQGQGRVLL